MQEIKDFGEWKLITESRSKHISESEFDEILASNCSLYSPENVKIFRGINPTRLYGKGIKNDETLPDFLFSDPSMFDRKSAYIFNDNFFNFFMDNNPYFSEYPKRSKSLICSTSKETAKGFSDNSNVYEVIPFDNSVIGICPGSDIQSVYCNYGVLKGFLFYKIHQLLTYLLDGDKRFKGDWSEVVRELQSEKFWGFGIEQYFNAKWFNPPGSYKELSRWEFMELFMKQYTPENLGFELINYHNNIESLVKRFKVH